MPPEYELFLDALYRAPNARMVVECTGINRVRYTWYA